MSWWDTKSFSGLASQALKSAQKQIDKVLDIDEGEKGQTKSSTKSGKSPQASKGSSSGDGSSKEESNTWNSWSMWMSSKPSDSEGKAEAEASQSDAQSSWSFSWGSSQESSSTSSASSSSKGQTSLTTKLSASDSKVRPSAGNSKQKSRLPSREISSLVSETESQRSSLVSETESQRDDKSKDLLERLSDVGQTVDNAEVLQDVESLPALEEVPVRSSSPAAIETQDVESLPALEEVPVRSSSPAAIETHASETELLPQNSETGKAKEDQVMSERDSLSGEKDEASSVRASEPPQDTEQLDVKDAVTLSADSGTDKLADDKCVVHVSEQELSGKVDSECVLTESEQAEVADSQSIDSTEDVTGEALEPSASLNSCILDEMFETVPKDSGSGDTVESFDITPCDPGEGMLGEPSPDSAMSRDSSFAQISFSENVQTESVTSVSSEPTLLSMSTEDNSSCVVPDDASLFSPPSHSSLTSEENKEVMYTHLDASSPQDEQSPVSSPPLDSTITTSSNDSSETSHLDSSADTLVDRSQQLLDESESEKVAAEEGSGQEWLEDSSLADLDAATSPSASFVKCMIEDAMGMVDSSKHEDSSSDNHSEEKSESSKVDSEFEKSVYSGHESSDEVETTTSSDIEIISTPTPNGEKNIVDLSPLRFSLQKAARSQGAGHQRTDSQSSSSTNSKGEGEQLSPERDSDHHHDWHREGKGPGQQQDTAAPQDDPDHPQNPQRLLKSCKNQQEKDVVKKLAEMAEVLQARESKLVQLSKDNNDLLETNSILRSQLQQAEEARDAEMTDLNALTEEFTRRMGEAERKIQTILKEKESFKQQLQSAQTELARRSADVNLEAVLTEKDEQIAGLMEEGEKLSKQQLQNSTIIKKLRAKEKENDGLIASQKKKVDQQKEDLDRLKAVLDSKEDMEKKQADAVKQLNAAVQMIEKEKARLKVEVDSADEKIRGLQSTLDNSYKEIAELHKSNASQDSRAQQAALSAEMQVREELKMAMAQESQRYRQEKEALIMQIEDLRLSLARMEKDHNRREEMLKQEISDLQMRMQEDESRTQDLTQSVTSATRPLLRQIENLQATHSLQSSAWEKVEKNLTERLTEAQTLLALAQEKERTATEKLTEATSRCTALETSNSLLRQEKAQLAAQQDSDRRRLDMLEERKANDVAQLELAKQKLSDEVAALRRDKVFLESQLETERTRLESEKQRVAVAEEQIRILERERPKSRGTPSPVSVSRQESMNSSFSERSATPTWLPRSEEGEGQFLMGTGAKVSLYDSMRQSGAASLMENLQSQLKLREGEIAQLQADIQQLERTRESMARELVNLTNLNEELQEQVQELPKTRTEFKELNARYSALLQMYGEKEEKVQELMLDLEDVKEMYKQQINSLMQ